MAWSTPRTWVSSEVPTAAHMNANVRDNPTWLRSPPATRAYRQTDMAVSNAAFNVLSPIDSERFDTDTMHSISTNTSRITFTTAGVYLVVGHVEWDGNATGLRHTSIHLNSTTRLAAMETTTLGAGATTGQTVSTVWKFAAADYVEIYLYQNSGTNINVLALSLSSLEFAAHWLGAG